MIAGDRLPHFLALGFELQSTPTVLLTAVPATLSYCPHSNLDGYTLRQSWSATLYRSGGYSLPTPLI